VRRARRGTLLWRAGRRPRPLASAIAVLLAVGVPLALDSGGALTRTEGATVDTRFRLRAPAPPDDVLVVAVDDVTFSDLGLRWPFPRSLHAKLADRLRKAGARRIVFDIQFTEETTAPEDLALYDAVRRAPGTILATTEVSAEGATNVLGGDENLAAAGAFAGSSTLPTGAGGIIRRFPRGTGGLDSMAVRAAETIGGRVLSGDLFSHDGALIDYRGPPGTIPTVSYSEVLAGRVPAAAIVDTVVVVGAFAPSLGDVHLTPISDEPMAGPEIQANAIWTALNGVPLRDAPASVGFLAIIVLGLAGPVLARWVRAVPAAIACVVLGGTYAAGALVAFERGVVVLVAAPLLACAAGMVTSLAAGYLAESRERRRADDHNEVLERLVRERTEELRETQIEVIRRLGQAAESRDEDTGLHIERMSRMCEALGRAIGMSEAEAERLRLASALHDVGKIGIPDGVLLKAGRLDPDELDVMRTHTVIGASILAASRSPLVRLAEEIAMTHHEKWDGSGYPHGLAGEEIPLCGRIAAVCDVFDALMARRPYKESWALEDATAEMARLSGSHFDPRLVPLFLEMIPGLVRQLELVSAPSSRAVGAP
jgi:CHASE2 domain-containing sensor protein